LLLVAAGGESSWLCHLCRGLNQQRLGGRFCPRRGGECKHANVRHVMIIFVCLLASFVQLVLILVCACPKHEQALAPCLVCSDDHKWLISRPLSNTPCLELSPVSRPVRRDDIGGMQCGSHKGAAVQLSNNQFRRLGARPHLQLMLHPRGKTGMLSETLE
jgi:hypothetical protein